MIWPVQIKMLIEMALVHIAKSALCTSIKNKKIGYRDAEIYCP